MLSCALFLVIIPILAMMAHWSHSYVAYGLTHLPLASTFIVISLSALAVSLFLNHRREYKLAPAMIGASLLVAVLAVALGDAYLCLALAGCC